MKTFRVWIDFGLAGADAIEETLEFPDDATEEEIEEACSDCLQMMISNGLDTGWQEVE